jgi:hypothetical protein
MSFDLSSSDYSTVRPPGAPRRRSSQAHVGVGPSDTTFRRGAGTGARSRRLPRTEHTARSWRIHEITSDFRLVDVWAYRAPGAGRDEFPATLAVLLDDSRLDKSPSMGVLRATGRRLGALLGYDEPGPGYDRRGGEPLRDRLPPDLRQSLAGTAVADTKFTLVYELPDECAVELVNRTVHKICHLSWVLTDSGEYELRMAALVKSTGTLGRLTAVAMKPLRHLVAYPTVTRSWARAWRDSKRDLADRHVGPSAPGSHQAAAVSPSPQEQAEPHRAAPRQEPPAHLIRWAGRLIVCYGAAHTLGALIVERAAQHAGAWLSGELRGDSLRNMSPANSAYWLSVNSFGPPLVLLGLTVLWLDRRGITPPTFIAWALGTWTVVDAVIAGPAAGEGLILLLAVGLLLAGARGARRHADHALHTNGAV